MNDGTWAQSEITALATVRSAEDLRVMFRQRIVSLGITFETADALAGLPVGYTAKLLGPTPLRRFGPMSLEALLGATGLKLLAVEDADAMARVKGRHVRRERRLVQRAGFGDFVRTIDSNFMRKIGALGGFKTGQVRRAVRTRKLAERERNRQNALKRWHPEP